MRSQSNLQNREAEGEQGLACAREEFLEGGCRKLGVIPTNIAPPTTSLITEITMMHVLANTAGEGCTGWQQGGWSQGLTRVSIKAPQRFRDTKLLGKEQTRLPLHSILFR